MQVTAKRGETPRVKLTKAEAGRLQDASYLLKRLAQLTERDDLMGPATIIRSVVEEYAPEWVEDENGVPAKHQPKPVAEVNKVTGKPVAESEEPFGLPQATGGK